MNIYLLFEKLSAHFVVRQPQGVLVSVFILETQKWFFIRAEESLGLCVALGESAELLRASEAGGEAPARPKPAGGAGRRLAAAAGHGTLSSVGDLAVRACCLARIAGRRAFSRHSACLQARSTLATQATWTRSSTIWSAAASG